MEDLLPRLYQKYEEIKARQKLYDECVDVSDMIEALREDMSTLIDIVDVQRTYLDGD